MDIKSYSAGSDFLAAAGDLLRTDEVRHGLIYSIARLVAVNPYHYGDEAPQFYIVFDNTGISTLAWRTPPHLVGLAWHAGNTHEAVSLLIEFISRRWRVIPGVPDIGRLPICSQRNGLRIMKPQSRLCSPSVSIDLIPSTILLRLQALCVRQRSMTWN